MSFDRGVRVACLAQRWQSIWAPLDEGSFCSLVQYVVLADCSFCLLIGIRSRSCAARLMAQARVASADGVLQICWPTKTVNEVWQVCARAYEHGHGRGHDRGVGVGQCVGIGLAVDLGPGPGEDV